MAPRTKAKTPPAQSEKPPVLPPDNFWRQQDILNRDHWGETHINLIGVGGIGSPTALTLAKMGLPSLTLWDPDMVELHNLPNQMFRPSDLGTSKVIASRRLLGEFARTKVEVVPERYTKDSPALAGITISAVDSMAARKEIWEAVSGNPKVPLYIEARMGAQALRIYSLQKPLDTKQTAWYEETLYTDEKALKAPCTAQAIMYTVMVAAGFISNQVKRFVRGETLMKEVVIDLTMPYILVE